MLALVLADFAQSGAGAGRFGNLRDNHAEYVMKTHANTLCRLLVLIALTIAVEIPRLGADAKIVRRPRSDQAIFVLQGAKIEPNCGWHYLMTNRSLSELTVMLEIFISYGPEDELNRTILFKTNRELIHFGVGLQNKTETQSNGLQYEFQLYVFDDSGLKSDRVKTIQIDRIIEQKSENYIDADLNCESGKRYVLGDFVVTAKVNHIEKLENMIQPDWPVDGDTDGLDAKLSVSIYEKQ